MEKSPLNFIGQMAGLMRGGANPQSNWQLARALGQDLNTNPAFQAQAQASAAAAQDPNNITAQAFGSPTGATGIGEVGPTYGPPQPGLAQNNFAPPPVQGVGTGSFSPQAQQVAGGIYGDTDARQTAAMMKNKPLINIF